MVKKKIELVLNEDGTVGPDHEPVDGAFAGVAPDTKEEDDEETESGG